MIAPLPYSAFPEELAHHVGAMTVAYQRIEDEIPNLIQSIAHIEPDALNVFLLRIRAISNRLQILQELSKVSLKDDAEISRLKKLCEKVSEVGQERNSFIHSATYSFDKQTGDVFQFDKKKKSLKRLGSEKFELLINRMYLILAAFDQRFYGVDDWDNPFGYWDSPIKFWKQES